MFGRGAKEEKTVLETELANVQELNLTLIDNNNKLAAKVDEVQGLFCTKLAFTEHRTAGPDDVVWTHLFAEQRAAHEGGEVQIHDGLARSVMLLVRPARALQQDAHGVQVAIHLGVGRVGLVRVVFTYDRSRETLAQM